MAKATKWEDVKADLRAKGRFDDEKVQANMERLRSEIRMHRPTEIREALGITQQFLAEQIGISQSRVSQIERGELEHTEVATLRSYFREARRRGRGGRPTRRRTFTDRLTPEAAAWSFRTGKRQLSAREWQGGFKRYRR